MTAHPLVAAALALALGTLTACGGGGGGSSGGGGTINPPGGTGNPPPNNPPTLSGPSSFAFDESEVVEFKPEFQDSDSQTLDFSLATSGDSNLFTIDNDGTIGLAAGIGPSLDFEDPKDADQDNVYELTVTVSDGTNSPEFDITLTIRDVPNALSCNAGDTIDVLENSIGDLYVFTPAFTDPGTEFAEFNNGIVVSQGGSAADPDLPLSFSISTLQGVGRELTIVANQFINVDTITRSSSPILVEAEVTSETLSATCSVTLNLVDIETEVNSGLKISGSNPDETLLRSYSIGDLDGDGLDDYWVSTRTIILELPWVHNAYILFGSSLKNSIDGNGAELVLSGLSIGNSVRITGSFPQVRPGRFVGNDLIPTEIGDVDGDGFNELLISLQTPPNALESTSADRPMAYLLWGDALATNSTNTVSLNNLTPTEGIEIGGLAGIDRKGNQVASGDFDADGIPDVIIGIPGGAIEATATSKFRGQIFIIYGSHIRSVKGDVAIDLLESIGSIDPDAILLMTAEDEDDIITGLPDLPLLAGAGFRMVVMPDIDGDGGNELATNGNTVEQFTSNIGIIRSGAVTSSKGNNGFLQYDEIAPDNLTVITVSDRLDPVGVTGDVDGDGIHDLVGAYLPFSSRRSLATVVFGSAIAGNTSGNTLDVTMLNDQSITFTVDEVDLVKGEASDATILPDLDGDSLAEVVVAYRSPVTDESSSAFGQQVAIVRGSAVVAHDKSTEFRLDQMTNASGIRLYGAGLTDQTLLGLEINAIGDLNGDGFPELGIFNLGIQGREAYVVDGRELATRLSSDADEIELSLVLRSIE